MIFTIPFVKLFNWVDTLLLPACLHASCMLPRQVMCGVLPAYLCGTALLLSATAIALTHTTHFVVASCYQA